LPTGGSARTLEAWVRTTSGANMAILGYGSNCYYYCNGHNFRLKLANPNQLVLAVSSDDYFFSVPYSVADGNWHQVAATFDGSSLVMYLDGLSLSSQGAGFNTVPDSNGLQVGTDDSGSNWSGSVDEA